jgi:hypothetical protein
MRFHAVDNNAFTTLAATLSAVATSAVVDASTLDAIEEPFYADIGSELIEVTTVTPATPTAGKSTWTIVRAVEGTAAAYAIDAPVVQRVYAQQTTEIHNGFLLIQRFASDITGSIDLVVGAASLAVAAKSPASMSVSVASGTAIVSSMIVGFTTAQTVTLTAPVSGNRTDCVQLSNLNVLSVKTNSATPDTDNIGLASIDLTDATTTITTGMITDIRTFS